MKSYLVAAVVLGLTLPTVACAPKGPVAPAAKPKRPVATPTKKPLPPQIDCPPTVIEQSPPAVPYKSRVIVESENLSKKGIKLLDDSTKDGLDPALREQMVVEGVDDLITALKADPYNVAATYSLAAAYARIERPQCSINLLDRLSLLRKLASHRSDVEKRVDRLLGRGRYSLDPSFDKMRAEDRFRTVVEKLIAPL